MTQPRVSCSFPSPALLAATWDVDAAYAVGELMAVEALRLGPDVMQPPLLDLQRSPLQRRLFEAFSEDPLLTGKLASAQLEGLRKSGNDVRPRSRLGVGEGPDERTLHEVHRLPLEIVNSLPDPATGELAALPAEPDSKLRQDQLSSLAAAGMTLLSNDGLLPIAADLRVALVGRYASQTVCRGHSSLQVSPPHEVNVVEAMQQRYGDRLSICEDAHDEAIRSADVAVVVVGRSAEHESMDRTTLALPDRQDELVYAVAAVSRKTVVVVNAAGPVLMPWLPHVDAVLWAGLPGQEAGDAVAAVLLGELEPAGRLAMSIPVAEGASPAWTVTGYAEGPYVGYRGHAPYGMAPAPLFWFGHGLGFGEWEYGDASVAGRTVTVEVTNASAHDSREVVQVYLDPQRDGHPVRLVGWSGVEVRAGATATATVDCDERMWRTWNTGEHGWDELTGGELLVGRSAGDIRRRLGA